MEEQFRFLWRLHDRDGDGKIGRADLVDSLQLRKAQLGWDDQIAARWVNRVYDVVPSDRGGIAQDDLLAGLRGYADLRLLFMCREPLSSKPGRRPTQSLIVSMAALISPRAGAH